ncbi:MAG: UDP-N-acetylmuramoyl-L-alanyl-D-glutamate--2,6-diaminopimelate ligase [Anaerolineaceae bacterium]|nr:UDP-N-acetylmuramoyl-L-alanyl-D-glutamate--2,6-diaminopimelate ligase [Anaerolineaceae bacterium]MBN2676628.1 UDP-N-acetylmuramoyl-L-alanyl-D-glutamate--2,6-diaminopimelate ligase [Anaerolineaceae bacterium]
MKKLSELFIDLPDECPKDCPDIPITGISLDSRQVKPGHLFVALTGGNVDGHQFVGDAIRRGAVAVVGSRPMKGYAVPYLQVENARHSLAWICSAFNDHPSRSLVVIGVTGTDGKTTTCNLIHRILLAAGIEAGMISTVNAVIGKEVMDTGFHVTTPEAPNIQDYLAKMVKAGMTHVVLETTSHGLYQERVTGIEVDVAVVTNVTHEHLDYHGSYDAYLKAKGILLQMLLETCEKPFGNPRTAVINQDDQSYQYLSGIKVGSRIVYGSQPNADLSAEDIRFTPTGMDFYARSGKSRVAVHCQLAGAFNVANCMAAIGATHLALGIPSDAVSKGIAGLHGIPGRMERIDLGQPFTAIVDFAHTPNALRVALEALRPMTQGRLIAVYGSAGLRDQQKRRMMAETSANLADISIFTAEDPRTESLDDILSEMAKGAVSQGGVEDRTFFRVPDRGEAIRQAVRMAKKGDIVVACGKGHEQSMCFGETEYPWDDRTALRAALSELMGIEGIKMPYLPTQD